MTQEELQEKIKQFLASLPDDDGIEWYDDYRGFGETILNAFLWWLYPELKPEGLLPWQEFPPYSKEGVK